MPTDKRIFITGATGFIGANLAQYLAQNGALVNALVRSPEKAKKYLSHPNINCIVGDISKPSSYLKAMDGCEEVYHLAAFARMWHKNPQIFHDLNVTAAVEIARTAVSKGVRRFVFTSSAGVIGPSFKGPVTEDSTVEVQASTLYEVSKSEAEKRLLGIPREDMKLVIVNPTRVYGPGLMSQSNAVTLLIDKYGKGQWRILPGDGSGIGNYVYVWDVVLGHILAQDKGRDGHRYILGGENASYKELFQLISKQTSKNYRLIKVPVPMMMTIAKFEEIKATYLRLEPKITPGFVKKYLYDWNTDHSKAMEELGYRSLRLEEGISKTLQWLKSNEAANFIK